MASARAGPAGEASGFSQSARRSHIHNTATAPKQTSGVIGPFTSAPAAAAAQNRAASALVRAPGARRRASAAIARVVKPHNAASVLAIIASVLSNAAPSAAPRRPISGAPPQKAASAAIRAPASDGSR